MTPDERAEKIKSLTRNCAVSDDNELTALIAAEIAIAEEVVRTETIKRCNEIRDCEIRAAVEEVGVVCDRQGAIPYSFTTDEVKRFKAEAYEDAAKIADTLHPKPNKTAEEIRDAIRARAAEVGK